MIIFDLDGTLANIEHRVHLLPDWDAFYEACDGDSVNEEVCAVLDALEGVDSTDIQVWSGRSEVVREKTETWLTNHVSPCFCKALGTLRMRPEGDFTPDEQLKERWLREVGAHRISMVFDDRDKVVAMWRSHGIRCFQVAPGDF